MTKMKFNYITKTIELDKFNCTNLEKILSKFLHKNPLGDYFIYFSLLRKSTNNDLDDDIEHKTVTINVPIPFYDYPLFYNIFCGTFDVIIVIYNFFMNKYVSLYKLIFGDRNRERIIIYYPIAIEKHLIKIYG
jgi:hypothetical protein